jgi:hypothetical protein
VGLGKDFSGNGNYWTTNNISITAGSTYDSMTDVPTLTDETTANYCVLNPLVASTNGSTTSNGNLKLVTNSGGPAGLTTATIGVSSGKWYWEQTTTADDISAGQFAGIISSTSATTGYVGSTSQGWGYYNSGSKYNNNSATSYGASWGVNDVIGVALDMDAGTITFYKNNISQGTAFTGLSGTMFPAISDGGTGAITVEANFGQRPFAYTPPTGFVALNTFNLPTPTIGATATTQANDYFDAKLWTGNGSSQTISTYDFQPDFAWIKTRSTSDNHNLMDAVRGATKRLISNSSGAEATETQMLTAFTSNGFSLGTDAGVNGSGTTYVGWAWKANGAGSSNTAGSITSTVSANTSAGFSVVTYTGTGSNATVGHGLGVAPSMVIVKSRSIVDNWRVGHNYLNNGSSPWNYSLILNATIANSLDSTIWNNTAPTSSVFSIGTDATVNQSSATYVAYCFSEIAGYSKFGSYTGNFNADGPFIYTGFKPKFVMLKASGDTGSWNIVDGTRNPSNVVNARLFPNSSIAENTATVVDFLSNGFKIRSSDSDFNYTVTNIYMAFAESPFKYANAR